MVFIIGIAFMILAVTIPADTGVAPNAIQVAESTDRIALETSALRAEIVKRGYVSGVAAGSFVDKKSGLRDAGFGLDIVEWIMEPGSDEAYRDKLTGDLK